MMFIYSPSNFNRNVMTMYRLTNTGDTIDTIISVTKASESGVNYF